MSTRNNNISYASADDRTTDTDGERDTEGEDFEEYAPPKETVILFLDVDSFDVQVRGRNIGIVFDELKTIPYVVVNEHNVITAVNYAAKACGVQRTRECTLERAYELCPKLQKIEIPNHFEKPDALEPRKASDEIYNSLEKSLLKWCNGRPAPKIEKASKDEFYVDLTDEVFHRVHRMELSVPTEDEVGALTEANCFLEAPRYCAQKIKLSFRMLRVLTNKSIIQERHVTEALLMHGAVIAHSVLQDIREETGFTLSAGISSNKLLAKIGCGHHKPDGIAVLPHSALPRVSRKIPITDIPTLGGKLGNFIKEKLNITNMDHLGHKNRARLIRVMGDERALKLHQLAVGYDPTKVIAKKFPNSLTCGITFNYRTRRMFEPNDFLYHLRNRFLEMREHLLYDCSTHGPQRIPKSFRVEVKTKKGNLKVAYGETEDLDSDLRIRLATESEAQKQGVNLTGSDLPEEWENVYEMFVGRIKQVCKINVLNEINNDEACAAIRKVSEINLIAKFLPMEGDED